MGKLRKEHKGFTIIEVVIVLAIAALIIVIVLLAVQALQRSQRTKAAQDAAGRLLQQMQNWESDHGGTTNLVVGQGLDAFSTSTYINNANIPTKFTPQASAAAADATHMNYAPAGTNAGAACNNDASIAGAPSSTVFAVSYWSETAAHAVCIHN